MIVYYDLCRKRQNPLFTRLKGRPELLREYDSIFKEQLASSIGLERTRNNFEVTPRHLLCT